MRRWLLPVSFGVLIVLIPLAVNAAIRAAGDGPLDTQAWSSRNVAISTSSTQFTNVPGMSVLTCSLGPVAFTFSGSLTGSQAGFRVLVDQAATLEPGAAFFKAANGTNAFSYTFVTNVGPFEANDGHSFELQWRSTGGTTTLLRGAVVVQYNDPQTCQG